MKTCGKFLTESDNPEQPVGGEHPTEIFRSILVFKFNSGYASDDASGLSDLRGYLPRMVLNGKC